MSTKLGFSGRSTAEIHKACARHDRDQRAAVKTHQAKGKKQK